MSIKQNLLEIKESLPVDVTLVAVSKTKPNEDLLEVYDAGQRILGENKVQELCLKHEDLPKDIQWHMIGHLQSNKVKYIAPFVALIHGVDKPKLLKEISKEAAKHNRTIDCLIQVYVAQEETKFGFTFEEVSKLFIDMQTNDFYPNVRIVGLMAMASHTEDKKQIKKEFTSVKLLFDEVKENYQSDQVEMRILSMGMSGDYQLAISCGSNMVRVGSSIFGQRNYKL
jgi:PLP dependent protein